MSRRWGWRVGAWALAAGCVALGAGTADAQTLKPFGRDPGTNRFESPQNFMVEFRGGPFLPDVDAEFGGRATPFRDMFGTTTGCTSGWSLTGRWCASGCSGSSGWASGWDTQP